MPHPSEPSELASIVLRALDSEGRATLHLSAPSAHTPTTYLDGLLAEVAKFDPAAHVDRHGPTPHVDGVLYVTTITRTS